MKSFLILALLALPTLLFAGCGSATSGGSGMMPQRGTSNPTTLAPTSGSDSGPAPLVRQKGSGSPWVGFFPKTTSTALYTYSGLVNGPDGNLWFQDMDGNGIVSMAETGTIKEFAVPFSESSAGGGMAVGSDGRFYLGASDTSNNLGYVIAVDTSGNATAYEIGTSEFNTDNLSGGVALGPDNNIWFVEYNHIGTITPSGTVTQYSYPSSSYYANPGDIVKGSDGNMWFTLGGADIYPAYLGKIVPSSGAMTFYNLTSLVGCSFDNALTEGPDGNVWVDCGTSIVRVTPAAVATSFATPRGGTAGEVSGDMTPGADQTIWYGGAADSGKLVQYNIAANTFAIFTPPSTTIIDPRQIITGPDGNMWFDGVKGSRMAIGVYVSNPMTVTPTSLTLSGPGATGTLNVTERGVASWTAKSSKRTIATVKEATGPGQLIVTAVAVGTCQITIADANGNSVSVKVTVT